MASTAHRGGASSRGGGARSRGRVVGLVLATILAAALVAVGAPAASASSGVVAWGDNFYGQLGNGTTANSYVPVAVSGLSEVTAVVGGVEHSLALLANGTVAAWGDNWYGELGDGTTLNSDVPVAVPGLDGVTALAAGEGHSLALLGDGRVMAWGENYEGQLGDGTTSRSDVPVAVCAVGTVGACPSGPYLEGVKAIAAGDRYSVALLDNGTVVAWGANTNGQLGDVSTTGPETCDPGACSKIPVVVSGLSGVTAIAGGAFHVLALRDDGTVMAWGWNGFGQLGDGTAEDSDEPVAVSGLSDVKAVTAGYYHSAALLADGTVVTWGSNQFGQLGDGSSEGPSECFACSTTPVPVSGLSGVTAISSGSGSRFTLALLGGGTVWGWGFNNSGQLGVGTATGPEVCSGSPCSTTPLEVSGLSGATAIAAGFEWGLATTGSASGPLEPPVSTEPPGPTVPTEPGGPTEPVGPTEPPGPSGPTEPPGSTGPTESTGVTGVTGSTGTADVAGAKGSKSCGGHSRNQRSRRRPLCARPHRSGGGSQTASQSRRARAARRA
jgi:alpha-tubulin suppressor-like RCC1 family protein